MAPTEASEREAIEKTLADAERRAGGPPEPKWLVTPRPGQVWRRGGHDYVLVHFDDTRGLRGGWLAERHGSGHDLVVVDLDGARFIGGPLQEETAIETRERLRRFAMDRRPVGVSEAGFEAVVHEHLSGTLFRKPGGPPRFDVLQGLLRVFAIYAAGTSEGLERDR